MNNKRSSGSNIGWLLSCVFIGLCVLSCKKDGPTRAIVTVLDSAGMAVQAADVTLWQDTVVNATNGVPSTLRVTKKSDAAGRAEFEFELEAFLNIEVIKSGDTGRSFIRLEEHETVEQTVHI
jgi:hypothetical protein